ncbi:MAG: AbrB/MazE/SpoVT family DNA-binding domain-containing protein [Ardenticatenaceae bacterium]|nr:AbrB/MazE/SpoVT family DNA-binding domain-containing protein [Ardenticatenaceae bacterium]MCB9444241.1 AbrB/MazE/SpoVT family DNA-binding domain-containing protein [Ardenticatenaceae bacterium]
MIVKVNGRYQITLPIATWKKLGIKTGDRLLIDIQDGVIVLIPQPEDYVEYMKGLHKEVWMGVDTAVYLATERE